MSEFFQECRVVRSARRRTIALVLNASGEAELRVPVNATETELHRVWEHFTPWLARKRRELAATPQEDAPFVFDFHIGGHFFFLGRELELEHAPSAYNSRLIRLEQNRLRFAGDEPTAIVLHMEAFYRRQAANWIPGKVERFAKQFAIAYNSVAINGAEHRYGSCNSRGDLNFSWRLMMYPERLVDLVICHELAHRAEMNHSAAFYRVLGQYIPDYRAREKELKLWGRRLSNYRLAAEKLLETRKNVKKNEQDLQKNDFGIY